MSQSGVFICPSCQAVIRSKADSAEGLICGECQFEFGSPGQGSSSAGNRSLPKVQESGQGKGVVRNLTAKKAPVVRVPKSGQAPPISAKPYEEMVVDEPPERDRGEILLPDGRTKIRKRKKRTKKEKNKPMILFLLGWVSVVVIVFALFVTRNKNKSDREDEGAREVDYTAIRDREFVETHQAELFELFSEYVFSPTMKGREQFIGRSSELALSFSRYYGQHNFIVPMAPIRVVRSNVIEVAKEPLTLAIEQVWVDRNRRLFGTVHYFDGQGWKLDWEAYAPYSDMSWSRFMSNLGDSEGEFRVLVRKRKSRDESERFSLSFYRPPNFTEVDDSFRKTESPEVEVPVDSELGKTFLKLWSDFKDGKKPLDSLLPNLDPEGFMRITVRLAWEDIEGRDAKRLVLREILEPGWFGGFIRERYQADQARKKEVEESPEESPSLQE